MQCLYRISDNSYVKPKIEHATKQRCLSNFLTIWPNKEIIIFKDKVTEETNSYLINLERALSIKVVPINEGSSAGSWRHVLHYALSNFPDDEIVYFVEDDYWHLPFSRDILLEGMERAHYVSLYDAPDKYIPASMGGNPLIPEDGADITKVLLTKSSHWRLTNSTTMTFATKVKTLREDLPVWMKWTGQGTHPHDFQAFLELRGTGRSLITPIPTLSTHCEPMWKAPLVDWDDEINPERRKLRLI